MSITAGGFCDKSICSVYYLIYRHSGDRQLSQYAFTLHQQFTGLKGFLGELYDLDEIERWRQKPLTGPVVNSPADLEHWIFSALRFTEADKRSI